MKGILRASPLDVGLPKEEELQKERQRERVSEEKKERDSMIDLSKECVSGGNKEGLCMCVVLCFSRHMMIVR